MTTFEIETLLKKLGVRETKAETYPNTYSLVSGSSFLAQQVNNRDSASWKKAEYVILTDGSVSQGIIEGWKKLTERDPLPCAIQKLCVPTLSDEFDVYDSQGKLIETNSLERIIKHTPDIVDFLNDREPLVNSELVQKNSSFTPTQVIYYGVPGCGKSNTIKEKLKSVPDFNKVCVVFHPDYTNSEFIGQIRPKIRNHSVTYEFVAGPFAKILRRAYLNPDQEFYLVIDEINRGKASAILGEVFQLCDRIKPNDEKDEFGYGPGWSVYGVDHEDLNDYIRDIKSFANESHDGCDTPVEFSEEDGRGEVSAYKSIDINWLGFGENGKLHFTENTAIRLPPNLSIFATMNTSDQNVFTLDNAFQRRFDMELVCNEFAKGSVDGFKTEAIRNQHDAKIAGTETSWGEFWEWANNKITQVLKGLSSTEDKRLGVWFVCNVNGEIPEKIFAEKVLKYLWDDAFKFKRPQIFAEGCDTLETLISKFHELKFGVFKSFGA